MPVIEEILEARIRDEVMNMLAMSFATEKEQIEHLAAACQKMLAQGLYDVVVSPLTDEDIANRVMRFRVVDPPQRIVITVEAV